VGITKNEDGTFVVKAGEQEQTFKTEEELDQVLSKGLGYDKGRAEFAEERKAFEQEQQKFQTERETFEKSRQEPPKEPEQTAKDDDWLASLFGTGQETKEVDAETLGKALDGHLTPKFQEVETKAAAAAEGAVLRFTLERGISSAIKSAGIKGPALRDDLRNAVIEKMRGKPDADLDEIPTFVNEAIQERYDELHQREEARQTAEEQKKLLEARLAGTNPSDLSRGGPHIELAENVKPFGPEHRAAQLAYIEATEQAGRV